MRRSTRKAILIVASLLLQAWLVAGASGFYGYYIGRKIGFRDGVVTMTQLLEYFGKGVEGPAAPAKRRDI